MLTHLQLSTDLLPMALVEAAKASPGWQEVIETTPRTDMICQCLPANTIASPKVLRGLDFPFSLDQAKRAGRAW